MATEKLTERIIEKGAEPSKHVSAQAYLHTAQAGAFVPLVQALITGALMGLTVFGVAIKLRVIDAWFYALVATGLVTTATWILLGMHWYKLTNIDYLEKITGLDLNRDGKIGGGDERAAKEVERTIKINLQEVTPEGHLRVSIARFPLDPDTMSMLATALLGGLPFTERHWTGAGKPLSLAQFREIRAEMIARGMLEPANPKAPQQGYRLTRAGAAAMRSFAIDAAESDPPTNDVNMG